jgi:LmbE family N-acetylglucosaminyl deacetylase
VSMWGSHNFLSLASKGSIPKKGEILNCCDISPKDTAIQNKMSGIVQGASSRALFFFAHPDDDVFITGMMKKYLRSGCRIRAVWLTSGGYFGGQRRREQEIRLVTSELGLSSGDYDVLRLPDLGLITCMDEAASALSAILNNFRPDTVFVTAFEGGHPDHDAANFIVYEAEFRAKLNCHIFEFPLYNGAGSFLTWRWLINAFPPGEPATYFEQLEDIDINCKYNAMKIYASQWMYMIPARLARSRDFLKSHGELYRPCPPARNHRIPPHNGKLNYERWFNRFMKIKFTDFARAVGAVRTYF